MTHGLTGRFRLLDGESPFSLDDLIAKLTAEHHPYRETEFFLVRQMAELQLRIDRASSIEAELMLAVVDPGSPADSPHAILARAFLKDCEFDTTLLRLNRYESSLRRSYLGHAARAAAAAEEPPGRIALHRRALHLRDDKGV